MQPLIEGVTLVDNLSTCPRLVLAGRTGSCEYCGKGSLSANSMYEPGTSRRAPPENMKGMLSAIVELWSSPPSGLTWADGNNSAQAQTSAGQRVVELKHNNH